ncbi:hypothetical protein JD844_011652 [Phrynosoma platyrhinos]|uniref:Uncharacterized protein n=1 Tax=Phrynosoma platyrhinos TaxID=52577 RepID=A0ABQ7TIP0_PHRPL|nr:hypothetical protein JD844_011652 [Phrynosoma platyrhinos]
MFQEAPRCSAREYRFGGAGGREEEEEEEGSRVEPGLVVRIPEVLDPQYSMYVWPCAVVLAQYVWFHRRLVSGKNILEVNINNLHSL